MGDDTDMWRVFLSTAKIFVEKETYHSHGHMNEKCNEKRLYANKVKHGFEAKLCADFDAFL